MHCCYLFILCCIDSVVITMLTRLITLSLYSSTQRDEHCCQIGTDFPPNLATLAEGRCDWTVAARSICKPLRCSKTSSESIKNEPAR